MKKLLTILSVLALSASLAHAADEEKPGKKGMTPEERFKKLDTNSDSSISLEEMKASPMGTRNPDKVDNRVKKLDTDSDGKLTSEEFVAGATKRKKGDKAAN